ncbi:MAG TPA: NUDIX hydrolase N-terminal domain-containing protein [Acidimicrobiales bacterium]|nr:NUDIX hydrolase N-terminal domain-containing protein [Acidimicrobiales bacterium]
MSGVPEKTLRRWAEALAGVAVTGMGFTESEFERERYEEVLRIAGDIKAAANEGLEGVADADGAVVEWMAQVGEGVPGYVTPKVAVGAAVADDQGRLLLIKRADSGYWLYPTGWCDVGYSAPEVVVKEVFEETGVEVEPVRLIGVLDGMRLGSSRIPLYSLLFYCRATGGELTVLEHEATAAGWFGRDELPSPIVGAELWADPVFAAIRGEARDVFYDDLRRPVWRTG